MRPGSLFAMTLNTVGTSIRAGGDSVANIVPASRGRGLDQRFGCSAQHSSNVRSQPNSLVSLRSNGLRDSPLRVTALDYSTG